MNKEVKEEVVKKRLGVEWIGYGRFSTKYTEEEIFNWIDTTKGPLAVLDNEELCSRSGLNSFKITLLIEKIDN